MDSDAGSESILVRLTALARSATTDAAPQIRETIQEANLAIARAIARARLLEIDLREAVEAEAEWRDRASDAADRAEARRAQGENIEADRLEELLRVARRRQQGYAAAIDAARDALANQSQLADALRDARQAVQVRWDRSMAMGRHHDSEDAGEY